MKLLDKYKEKKKQWQEQMARGYQVTFEKSLQRQDERKRKRLMAEPGTLTYGRLSKQNPIEFMHDTYARRKRIRADKESKRIARKDRAENKEN